LVIEIDGTDLDKAKSVGRKRQMHEICDGSEGEYRLVQHAHCPLDHPRVQRQILRGLDGGLRHGPDLLLAAGQQVEVVGKFASSFKP